MTTPAKRENWFRVRGGSVREGSVREGGESMAAGGRPQVRLHAISKAYEDGAARHDVLTDISLDVAAGELVALLGPSGSGKSTLLNIIAGLDAPDSGSVEVSGHNLGAMSERGRTLLRRRDIGFVFQFFNLIPTLTALENVLLPLELVGRRDAQAARALLERVGLADRARAFPEELSGGEQQRIAIARALAHQPRLLLADEPTGNLDSATGARVLDLLTGLVREHGAAMVIATHSRDVVERAHRVLTLHDGMIVRGP